MMARVLAAAVLSAALTQWGTSAHAQLKERTSIIIGNPAPIQVSIAPLALAIKGGFLEAENIDAQLIQFDGAANLLPQIVQKRVAVAYVGPDGLIVSRQPERTPYPIKLFYNLIRSNIWDVVVNADSDVRSLQDLRGKRLGVGSLTFSSVIIFKAVLKRMGLDPEKDLQIIPVGSGAPATRALTTKQVDALYLFDMQSRQVESSGITIRRLEMPESFMSLLSNGLAGHEDLIRTQPELYGAIGRAMAKATVACQANLAACVDAYWAMYPDRKPTDVPPDEALKRTAEDLKVRVSRYFVFPAGGKRQWGHFPAESIVNYINVLADGGQISTRDIDPNLIVTNELVSQFNRFDEAEVAKQATKPK